MGLYRSGFNFGNNFHGPNFHQHSIVIEPPGKVARDKIDPPKLGSKVP